MLLLMACSGAQDAPEQGSLITAASTPEMLMTESRSGPINVDRIAPRLSWRSQVDSQEAYEIQVATSVQALDDGTADLWNSGRVADGRSLAIPYAGMPLQSRQKVFWRVRIWSEGQSEPSAWSEAASWQMALQDKSDWQASWITSPIFPAAEPMPSLEKWYQATAADSHFRDPKKVADTIERLRDVRPATYFRKDFTLNRTVKSAILYSTSAGYSDLYINGNKIGDRVLNPAQTDFDKRIYYDVDDITDALNSGTNVLAIHLGNGFYAERTAFGLDRLFYGEPAAITQLEITYGDGSRDIIVSDKSWVASPSPILKNGVYSGEVFDARKQVIDWAKIGGGDDANWIPADALEAWPTQSLIATEMPPVRKVREYKPQTLSSPAEGVWVLDFGQNFTGLPKIDFSQLGLNSGQTVLLRYAEWMNDEGTIGMKSGGSAPRTKQVDAYISDGRDEELWSPRFTWHGFRYLEVTGLEQRPPLNAFTAHLTRTDLSQKGQFASSSELLNRIHDTAILSLEGNLVSVLSDCPIRERNGWTGDAHAVVSTASYNFDFSPFLEKYLGDFRTTHKISPTVVPGRRTNSGKVDWAAAEVFLTWEHYLHSGDISIIERQYDSLIEYVDFVESILEDSLVKNKRHFYGDWCDTLPEPGMARPLGRCMSFSTPGELTASALIIRVYTQMADMATLMGRSEDSVKFITIRDAARDAFNAAFFDETTNSYGSQTGNAMALMFGIVPKGREADVAKWLEEDVRITWDGHHSVGALGHSWLYPALSDYDHTDTAYGIFTAPGYPGYAHFFETLNGTTLWEDTGAFSPEDDKEPGRSLNHPFKGGYDAWFYAGLGGIKPDPERPGYKHFNLHPVFPTDLDEAKIVLDTGYGPIHSAWVRKNDQIIWDVEIPFNTTAIVKLSPGADVGKLINPGRYRFYLDSSLQLTKYTSESL
jgi:alpha-L-rhamnosidase